MTFAIALGALIARLAFFALAAASIMQAFARRHTAGCLLALGAAACLMASSAMSAHDLMRLAPLGAILAALAAGALATHFLRAGRPAAATVFPYAIILISMGACLILDINAANPNYLHAMLKYAAFIAVGIIAFAAIAYLSTRNISLLSGHAVKYFALGVALLAVVLLVGQQENGAKSWLFLAAGTSIQPSEFAKIALIIAAAGYLAANASRLTQFSLRGIIPIALAFLISLAAVALQRDLGCALIIFLTLSVMMANSTKRGWVYLLLLAIAGVAMVVLAYHGFDHVRTRFDVWRNPLADPYGAGYQYQIAMQCLANGGVIGCGLGNGLYLENMPVAESDYIYAVLCEELGLMGCLLALACYAGIVWESARCAAALPRASFERNIIAAVGALIACEAALIVGGVTNLIPLTGITLPLVSRGGSSLVATMMALGLMLGASCSAKAAAVGAEVGETNAPGVRNVASHPPAGNEPRGTVYGAPARSAAPLRLKAPTLSTGRMPRIIAPHLFAVGMSALFCVCLATTAQVQLAEGGVRLCGETKHENLQGSIISSDGVTLAYDEKVATTGAAANTGDNAASTNADAGETPETADATSNTAATETVIQRVYPQGNLASHVIGECSGGLEYRMSLEGTNSIANILALPEKGDDLLLTLNASIQSAAERELAGQTGAAVVIDPETGRVLALASAPTYDLARQTATGDQSFFNRALAGQYGPGSTFKLIAMAAALENEAATVDSAYDAPAALPFGTDDAVTNYGNKAYGRISLTDALNYSANTAFAQVGMALGADELIETAERFGFNSALDFCLETQDSCIADIGSEFELAWAACGEGQNDATIVATPLQMALTMCAVANDGSIMAPHLISASVSERGIKHDRFKVHELRQAMSPKTAKAIRKALKENDAASAYCPYEIWGKTGTAQNDGAVDDAWYVCAAEHEGETVVVACVIEQGGTGATAALPRAARIATAALNELTKAA